MPTPVFGVAAGGDVCAALLLGAGVVGMLSGGLGVGDVLDGTKGVAIVLEGAGVGTALEGAGVAVMLGGAGVAVTMLEGAGAEVIEGAKVDAVGVAARLNGTEGCSNGGGCLAISSAPPSSPPLPAFSPSPPAFPSSLALAFPCSSTRPSSPRDGLDGDCESGMDSASAAVLFAGFEESGPL